MRRLTSRHNAPRSPGGRTINLVLLAALLGLALSSCLQVSNPLGSPLNETVQVTVDRSAPALKSQFAFGMTYMDNSLDFPWNINDPAAVSRAKTLIGQGIPFENTAIMAWGAPDPWPDPSRPEPGAWSYVDSRLRTIQRTGGIPVITLSEAPWWMKGELQPDGTTRLLKASDEWSDIAYNSRILDNKMDAWLHLVQRTAERYMAPPYNVRYFQVWNELKGYYNPIKNAFDYTTSSGEPAGPNARHGYTYMYNQVYARLMRVAGSLGIPQDSIKVGGPYVPIDTWSSANQSNPSNFVKAYGTYDQRSLDVIQYWLEHKAGAGFITLDGANMNKDGANPADPFVASEKFADLVNWLRSLDNARYPGATTLPVWMAEWYATSFNQTPDNQLNDAIKAYAMIKFLKAGGSVAFSWGDLGDGVSDTGLWTTTASAVGAQVLPWYNTVKAFKEDFPPGTLIYKATVSAPAEAEALASARHVMLVNRTASTISVSVNGSSVSLSRYQVLVVA